jgi:hypothetical protein
MSASSARAAATTASAIVATKTLVRNDIGPTVKHPADCATNDRLPWIADLHRSCGHAQLGLSFHFPRGFYRAHDDLSHRRPAVTLPELIRRDPFAEPWGR